MNASVRPRFKPAYAIIAVVASGEVESSYMFLNELHLLHVCLRVEQCES